MGIRADDQVARFGQCFRHDLVADAVPDFADESAGLLGELTQEDVVVGHFPALAGRSVVQKHRRF